MLFRVIFIACALLYDEGEVFLEQIINIDRMDNAIALFGSFDENIKIILLGDGRGIW